MGGLAADVEDHDVAHVVDVGDPVVQHPPTQAPLQIRHQRGGVAVDDVQGDLQPPLTQPRPHGGGGGVGAVADVDQRGVAHVVDVVDLVVQHPPTQAPFQIRHQRRVVAVHGVQGDVQPPRPFAQRSAVGHQHGHQQQRVDQHHQPPVVQVEAVDQAHDQGHEVVGHLLLGHRTGAQPDDRQDREQPEPQRDVHPRGTQQRDGHEDADVQRDVGQQQIRPAVPAKVQRVGQQEDRRQIDPEVDPVVGVGGEHVGDSTVVHLMSTTAWTPPTSDTSSSVTPECVEGHGRVGCVAVGQRGTRRAQPPQEGSDEHRRAVCSVHRSRHGGEGGGRSHRHPAAAPRRPERPGADPEARALECRRAELHRGAHDVGPAGRRASARWSTTWRSGSPRWAGRRSAHRARWWPQRTWDDYSVRRDDAIAHLGALDLVYAGVIADHRKAIEQTEELDPVTQDMLIAQSGELEQYQWFVRAHLEHADGTLSSADAKTEKGAARKARRSADPTARSGHERAQDHGGQEDHRERQVQLHVTDPHRREHPPHRADHRLGEAVGDLPGARRALTPGRQHGRPVQHGSRHQHDQEQQQDQAEQRTDEAHAPTMPVSPESRLWTATASGRWYCPARQPRLKRAGRTVEVNEAVLVWHGGPRLRRGDVRRNRGRAARAAAEHAEQVDGMTEIPPELVDRIRAGIVDV